ncbi:hypothetical protein U1Q18_028045, partial [Sarracenia purpurea var. burkii]
MIIERESESPDLSHSEVEESSPSAAEAGASMRSSEERTRTNGRAVAEREQLGEGGGSTEGERGQF